MKILIVGAGVIGAAALALEAAHRSRHPVYYYVESGYLLARAWLAAARGLITQARELSLSAADFARQHGQSARELLALQVSTQLGQHGNAERLGKLSLIVEGPRAPLATSLAQALAVDDADTLETVSRDFEAMGDRLAAADAPVYVIGTEVPVPGGAAEDLEELAVTAPTAASRRRPNTPGIGLSPGPKGGVATELRNGG